MDNANIQDVIDELEALRIRLNSGWARVEAEADRMRESASLSTKRIITMLEEIGEDE